MSTGFLYVHPSSIALTPSIGVKIRVSSRVLCFTMLWHMEDGYQGLEELDKPIPAAEIRELERSLLTDSPHGLQLQDLSDEDIDKSSAAARLWLFKVLEHAEYHTTSAQLRQVFTPIVQKLQDGQTAELSERDMVLLALTDDAIPTLVDCLKAGIVVLMSRGIPGKDGFVTVAAQARIDETNRAAANDAQRPEALSSIATKAYGPVDYFACAVPLAHTVCTSPSVVDDNPGCCPICGCSYTDISACPIEDLLADYPVRIKYCGHIFGKACLEKWMDTPGIDEDRIPVRTCPLCRAPLGLTEPAVPDGVIHHLEGTARGQETTQELGDWHGMSASDCRCALVACMSAEIAAEEWLAWIEAERFAEDDEELYAEQEWVLEDALAVLSMEKWAWGFRDEELWERLRGEWMESGVAREQ